MKKIDKPILDYSKVFDLSISNYSDEDLKERLENIFQTLESEAVNYDVKGNASQLYQLARHAQVGNVTKDELKDVYTNKLAKLGQPARKYYNKIKASAPNSICPFCNVREVKTLDHYLPKAGYPAFAVLPLNLIPSCSDCNKSKLAQDAKTLDEQVINPYYDDAIDFVWLRSEVLRTSPISFRFFVRIDDARYLFMEERLKTHFISFGLNSLYNVQAATASQEIRFSLIKDFGALSLERVRQHLIECAEVASMVDKNYWKAAILRGMQEDDWYCGGGYDH